MLTIPEKESSWKRWAIPVAIGSCVVFAAFTAYLSVRYLTSQPVSYATSIADIGDVQLTVNGYGRLAARQASSIVAQVDGVVSHIQRYPGTQLSSDEVVFRLTNPQLLRQKDSAEFDVLEARAKIEATAASHRREELQLQNEVELLQSKIAMSQRELDVMQSLATEGLVASLDLVKSQTAFDELKLKLELTKNSLETFQSLRDAEMRAVSYTLERAKKKLDLAEYEIDNLSVKAERAGILDEISENIEVGRSVSRGDVLAKVTDPTTLYADVMIPASVASFIKSGMNVEVSIKNQKVTGEVLRVYPSARNNQVRVEVAFVEKLPNEARPQLDVQAVIHIAKASGVTRIETPSYLRSDDKLATLLVLNGQNIVEREALVGIVGSKYTEIIKGISAGEVVLLNKPEVAQADN